MLSIFRLLILKASFPAIMDLGDKRVRQMGHSNNLLRKWGLLFVCVELIRASPSSPGNPRKSKASPPWPFGVKSPTLCFHRTLGSMLTSLNHSAQSLSCSFWGQRFSYLPLYPQHLSEYKAHSVSTHFSWMNFHALQNIITNQLLEKKIPVISWISKVQSWLL